MWLFFLSTNALWAIDFHDTDEMTLSWQHSSFCPTVDAAFVTIYKSGTHRKVVKELETRKLFLHPLLFMMLFYLSCTLWRLPLVSTHFSISYFRIGKKKHFKRVKSALILRWSFMSSIMIKKMVYDVRWLWFWNLTLSFITYMTLESHSNFPNRSYTSALYK